MKTWSAGEVLTASDLNAEFNNILNNPVDLWSPAAKAMDMDGNEIILDSDADTSITADSDDRIDVRLGGTDAVLLGLDSTNSSGVYTFDGRAVSATAATNVARVHVASTNALTIPAGTTAVAAGLWIAEPNLTATGTITTATTVYIAAAPTEGSTDYALWVDAGNVQFDGNLEVTGTQTFTGVTTHGGNVVSDTDSTDDLGTTGVRWANLYVDTITSTNALAIAQGGTASTTATAAFDALSPVTTRGDVIIRDASNNVRLAIGSSATVLRSDGTDPAWTALVLGDLPDGSKLDLQTELATTSGTTSDFTGIGSGIKKITIMFSGVSTNGTSIPIIQLGDAGGFETTGYAGVATRLTGTPAGIQHNTGFYLKNATWVATHILYGALTLTQQRADTNTWVISGVISFSDAQESIVVSGLKALSAALTQIRLTMTNGTDAFDAGAWNILLE